MFVYLYVMYVHSDSITTHHISQIISGAVPGKYLQANMDSLVKVILFVIEFILPCLLKTTIWIILLIDGFFLCFVLRQGVPLPYEGYDAFEEESHYPFDTAAGGSFCSSN